jgi:CheY-like chemotaxis protein
VKAVSGEITSARAGLRKRPVRPVNASLWEKIPLEIANKPPLELASSEPAAAEVAGNAVAVLLVDDVERFSYAASRYLQSMGYRVTTAASGMLALDALDRAEFDILVTECVMPSGTLRGAALGRIFRYRRAHSPIIFITSDAQITAAEGGLPGPILVKPIKPPELHAAISKTLWANREWFLTGTLRHNRLSTSSN